MHYTKLIDFIVCFYTRCIFNQQSLKKISLYEFLLSVLPDDTLAKVKKRFKSLKKSKSLTIRYIKLFCRLSRRFTDHNKAYKHSNF